MATRRGTKDEQEKVAREQKTQVHTAKYPGKSDKLKQLFFIGDWIENLV